VTPAALLGWDRDRIRVSLPSLGEVEVGLRGRHQAANVAVADALLDALEAAGIATAGADARRSGYASTIWPGRLELLAVNGHDVLLDGAHNPAGAAALATSLDDLRPYLTAGPLTFVTASMAEKDVDGVIAALARAEALRGATIITTSLDLARALPADALAARWTELASTVVDRVVAVPDAIAAVDRAIDRPGPTVVAGSLYLVGAVRAHLVDDPDLRDPPMPEPA
jgi:dihydrofolate synthase/folylpolyglutamate synthase